MFNLSPDILAVIKEQKLYDFLEATCGNTVLSGIACPDEEIAKIGAFHFVAVLTWFELQGITDIEEMKAKLVETLK